MIAAQENTLLQSELLENVQKVISHAKREVYGLHDAYFSHKEEEYLLQCVRTGWVSYNGKFVTDFEAMLAKTCGVEHAIAVSSGTVALHIALKMHGIQPGDEVLTPSLTFVATTNSVHQLGAIAHFVEACDKTLGLDPKKLDKYLQNIAEMRGSQLYNKQTGRPIKAIIPVHIFGHPVEIDTLLAVAQKYNLIVIEDAAESLGSYYKGKSMGSFGNAAIISFNGNKIVTTGGGGAVLTNDAELAHHIRHITTTAKQNHMYEYIHDEVAYNFRLPNINAALGMAQLEHLPEIIVRKRRLADKFAEVFANSAHYEFISEPANSKSNYWLNAVRIRNTSDYAQRNKLIEHLIERKIFARALWRPMHMLDIYKNNPRMQDLSITEDLYQRIICLPSSIFLDDEQA